MSGYDITVLFIAFLLITGYRLHLRAQRTEQDRRAAMRRHPAGGRR